MKYIAASLILLINFSCNRPSGTERITANLEDLIIDTLYLEKDTLTKNLGTYFRYFDTDSGAFLFTFTQHRLLQYSYPEGKLVHQLTFETEGPDGIGSFIPGHYIDKEYIYLVSQGKELIQADYSGKVLNRWPHPEVDPVRKYANYSSMGFNKIQKSGNELYFVDIPYVVMDGFETYDKWGIVFNIETQQFSHFNFSYPYNILDFIGDDQLGLFSHVYLPQSKSHLIGFAISDSLVIVQNGKQKKTSASTTENLSFKKGTTQTKGEYTVFLPNHESSKYGALDYAVQAEKIFRWVRVKGPSENNKSLERHKLLILNTEFLVEAELKFDTDQWGEYGFNTPDGYALPYYKESTDDIVAFVIVDFGAIR